MTSRWQTLKRSGTFGIDHYAELAAEYGMHSSISQTWNGQTAETIPNSFPGYVQQAYKANSVVFACHLTRLMLFSQIRFAYRRRNRANGRPGDLFYNSTLDLLERPWAGGTTGDLAARMIQDVDFAGNAFLTVWRGRIHRLRPDHVWIVLGSDLDARDPDLALDSHVIGYVYDPPALANPRVLLPEDMAHFAPIPDPIANFRGMSWVTPVLREVQGDQAATTHKLKFYDNAATPNIIIQHQSSDHDKIKQFAGWFREQQEGMTNAYKTLHLAEGADPKVVGADFKSLDFAATLALGEDRIAAAAGVHPSIVGLSDGLSGSSLNAGNFGAARRLTADRTLRFLWGNAASSLETLFPAPARSQLWYDARDVPFLQEDEKDAADIQQTHAATISSYVSAGFTPESAVAAVVNGDTALLEHTGLVSVQLLPPGTEPGGQDPDTDDPATDEEPDDGDE